MTELKKAMVVVQDNGDIAVYDHAGQYVCTADVRPISFGGNGFDGLLSAIQHAINTIPEHKSYIYRFRGSDPGSPEEINRRRVIAAYSSSQRPAPQRSRARYAQQKPQQSQQNHTVDFSKLGI